MLTSTSELDQITVTNRGVIAYREVRRVFDNGVLIFGPAYHRGSYSPGDDLTNAPPQVAAMAQFVWTPEVLAAWQAQQQQQQP